VSNKDDSTLCNAEYECINQASLFFSIFPYAFYDGHAVMVWALPVVPQATRAQVNPMSSKLTSVTVAIATPPTTGMSAK